jgi:hypothetical protein
LLYCDHGMVISTALPAEKISVPPICNFLFFPIATTNNRIMRQTQLKLK